MGLLRSAKETAKKAKAKKRKKEFDKSRKIEEAQTRPKQSLMKQKPAPKTKATPKKSVAKKAPEATYDKVVARKAPDGRSGGSGRKPKTITKKQAADLEKDLDKMFKKDSRNPGRKTRRDSAYGDRSKKAPIRGAAARRRAKKK